MHDSTSKPENCRAGRLCTWSPWGWGSVCGEGGHDRRRPSSSAADSTDVTLSTTASASLLNTQGLIAGFGDLTPGKDNFVGIINAISQDSNSNILSTPSIMAMDNELATSIIGQEIPITTGESLGTNNANPFRTTSRQEVGIKLEVTPQINEGSSVVLQIKIEVSGVEGVPMSGIDIITNKRAIETTALVDNNQIIVLGGLVDEDTQDSISKVPFLGSVPLLGKLFQSSSSTKSLHCFNLSRLCSTRFSISVQPIISHSCMSSINNESVSMV